MAILNTYNYNSFQLVYIDNSTFEPLWLEWSSDKELVVALLVLLEALLPSSSLESVSDICSSLMTDLSPSAITLTGSSPDVDYNKLLSLLNNMLISAKVFIILWDVHVDWLDSKIEKIEKWQNEVQYFFVY